jgi:DNA-binding transcriptional MerR regulator
MSAAPRMTEKSAEAYRSIGEVARELDLPTHVLRYWETKFPRQVRPVKRPDGRRLFRPADIDSLRAIQTLVHKRGMTLKGAKALLAEQGVGAVLSGDARVGAGPVEGDGVRELQAQVHMAFGAEETAPRSASPPDASGAPASRTTRLQATLHELTDIKRRLDTAREREREAA